MINHFAMAEDFEDKLLDLLGEDALEGFDDDTSNGVVGTPSAPTSPLSRRSAVSELTSPTASRILDSLADSVSTKSATSLISAGSSSRVSLRGGAKRRPPPPPPVSTGGTATTTTTTTGGQGLVSSVGSPATSTPNLSKLLSPGASSTASSLDLAALLGDDDDDDNQDELHRGDSRISLPRSSSIASGSWTGASAQPKPNLPLTPTSIPPVSPRRSTITTATTTSASSQHFSSSSSPSTAFPSPRRKPLPTPPTSPSAKRSQGEVEATTWSSSSAPVVVNASTSRSNKALPTVPPSPSATSSTSSHGHPSRNNTTASSSSKSLGSQSIQQNTVNGKLTESPSATLLRHPPPSWETSKSSSNLSPDLSTSQPKVKETVEVRGTPLKNTTASSPSSSSLRVTMVPLSDSQPHALISPIPPQTSTTIPGNTPSTLPPAPTSTADLLDDSDLFEDDEVPSIAPGAASTTLSSSPPTSPLKASTPPQSTHRSSLEDSFIPQVALDAALSSPPVNRPSLSGSTTDAGPGSGTRHKRSSSNASSTNNHLHRSASPSTLSPLPVLRENTPSVAPSVGSHRPLSVGSNLDSQGRPRTPSKGLIHARKVAALMATSTGRPDSPATAAEALATASAAANDLEFSFASVNTTTSMGSDAAMPISSGPSLYTPPRARMAPTRTAPAAPSGPSNRRDVYFELLYQDAKMRREAKANPTIPDEEQFSFAPSISARASAIDNKEPIHRRAAHFQEQKRKKLAELARRIQEEEDEELTFAPKVRSYQFSTPRAKDFTINQAMYEEKRKQKMEELHRAAEDEVAVEATFKPNISEYSRRIAPKESTWERLVRTPVRNTAAPVPEYSGTPKTVGSKKKSSGPRRSLDHLYEEAEARRARLDAQRAAAAKEKVDKTNTKVITARSEKLARRRFDKQLRAIFKEMDADNSGSLSHEEVLDGLHKLGMLTSSEETTKPDTESKELVDALFASMDPASTGQVGFEAWQSFMSSVWDALASRKQGRLDETGELQPPALTASASITSLPTKHQVKFIAKLAYSRLHSSSIGHVRPEAKEDPNLTFSPALNRNSVRLARATATPGRARHEQLFMLASAVEKKREAKAEAQRQAELAECTFTPVINKGVDSTDGFMAVAVGADGKPLDAFSRLHATPRHRIPPNVPSEEERQMAECTFQPNVGQGSASERLARARASGQTAKLPRDYTKAISRMRTAAEEKRERDEEAARILSGIPAKSTANAKPFSFVDRPVMSKPSRDTPVMIVEVELGGSKKGRIPVHEGDDPQRLARSFAAIYALDAAETDQLVEILLNQVTPTVTRLTVEGEPVQGHTLVGVGEHTGGQGTWTSRWTRVQGEGAVTPVGNVDSAEYIPTSEDVGCLLQFTYAPVLLNGSVGQARTATVGPVTASSPRVTNVHLIQEHPGEPLSALVGSGEYAGGSEGQSSFLWQRLSRGSTEPVAIPGALGRRYVPTQADFHARIRFGFVPTRNDAVSGEPVWSAFTDPIIPDYPLVQGAMLEGPSLEGSRLRFTGTAFLNCSLDSCRWSWWRGSSGSLPSPVSTRTLASSGWSEVPQAEDSEYDVGAADVGKFLAVMCVPSSGDSVGPAVAAVTSGPISAGDPSWQSLSVAGSAMCGGALHVESLYWGGTEGLSEYQWERRPVPPSPSEGAEVTLWTPIHGACSDTHVCTPDDVGAEIRVMCTPVRSDGAIGVSQTAAAPCVVTADPAMESLVNDVLSSGSVDWEVTVESRTRAGVPEGDATSGIGRGATLKVTRRKGITLSGPGPKTKGGWSMIRVPAGGLVGGASGFTLEIGEVRLGLVAVSAPRDVMVMTLRKFVAALGSGDEDGTGSPRSPRSPRFLRKSGSSTSLKGLLAKGSALFSRSTSSLNRDGAGSSSAATTGTSGGEKRES